MPLKIVLPRDCSSREGDLFSKLVANKESLSRRAVAPKPEPRNHRPSDDSLPVVSSLTAPPCTNLILSELAWITYALSPLSTSAVCHKCVTRRFRGMGSMSIFFCVMCLVHSKNKPSNNGKKIIRWRADVSPTTTFHFSLWASVKEHHAIIIIDHHQRQTQCRKMGLAAETLLMCMCANHSRSHNNCTVCPLG